MMKNKILIFLFLITSVILLNINQTYAATPIVDTIYTTYTTNTPVNSMFGTSTRTEYGIASKTSKVVFQSWWGMQNDYSEYNDIYYVVYKFSKPVNARIKRIKPSYVFISSGTQYTYTTTISQGTSYTYETSMEYELSITYSQSTELSVSGLNFGGAGIGGKVSTNIAVENKISTSVKNTTSYTYDQTTTESYNIPVSESSYYAVEERANFNVYVIQVYKAQYSQSITNGNTLIGEKWFTYTKTGYKLIEQNVKYTYINDTLQEGFFKYLLNESGKFIYNDYKATNIVYL